MLYDAKQPSLKDKIREEAIIEEAKRLKREEKKVKDGNDEVEEKTKKSKINKKSNE